MHTIIITIGTCTNKIEHNLIHIPQIKFINLTQNWEKKENCT